MSNSCGQYIEQKRERGEGEYLQSKTHPNGSICFAFTERWSRTDVDEEGGKKPPELMHKFLPESFHTVSSSETNHFQLL